MAKTHPLFRILSVCRKIVSQQLRLCVFRAQLLLRTFYFRGVIKMDLYKEILAQALTYGEVKITFPGEAYDLAKIVEGECYKALEKIKAIIQDNSLSDKECFMKIEEIVDVLESVWGSGGNRHDFG